MMQIYSLIEKLNAFISDIVWGTPMMILIFFTGVYFTIKLRLFQITKVKLWISETFLAIFKTKAVTKTKDKNSITQFQAMSTALAATIGTGNIAGVATAIAVGGAGSIFWMWVCAIFGMMTSFAENTLGIYYRKKDENSNWQGGPMYYIQDGLKEKKHMKKLAKPLALTFAIFCMLASFGIGNMTQANSISTALKTNFGLSSLVTGLVLLVSVTMILSGGIKRIGSVTEKLVPFMALFYILGCLFIFFSNFEQIPFVFKSIITNAFSTSSIAGAGSGIIMKKCINMGFKRGIFSNEAGLGSSVMVSTSSNVKEPVVQGMWGIFGVFCDTILVCTLTSFVILSTTVEVKSFDEAIENISKTQQYFSIAQSEMQSIPLADTNSNSIFRFDNNGETITLKTQDGNEFDVKIAKNASDEINMTYTNIMSIKGVSVGENNGQINAIELEQVEGVNLVIFAFSQRIGGFAGTFLAIAISLFAFSTIIGWSFYGDRAAKFLLGERGRKLYKFFFILFVFVGANMKLSLVWDISDTLNGLMAIPNLIGILMLSSKVVDITKNYLERKKDYDVKPIFSNDKTIQKENEIDYFFK